MSEEHAFFAGGFQAAFQNALHSEWGEIAWNALSLMGYQDHADLISEIIANDGSLKDRTFAAVKVLPQSHIKSIIRIALEHITDSEWQAVADYMEFEE